MAEQSAIIIQQLDKYVVVFISEDADAVARGNGYSADTIEDARARNAYAHTHVSAEIVLDYPLVDAETLGDYKESGSSPSGINSADEYKDQYNNALGRKIGDWLKNWLAQEELQGRTYTDVEKEKFLDDLVRDADNSGAIIKNEATDSRTIGFDENDPLYQNPADDVTWVAPTTNWQNSSAGRDFSQVDDFRENPIGFVLDLPQEAAGYVNSVFQSLDDALSTAIDGLGGVIVNTLPDWFVNNVLPLIDTARNEVSPLILDLDGDGIELISLNSSSAVYWDLDQDGMAEATGWAAGDDGLLAYDWNGDGAITEHSELFGSATIDGFAILSTFDSNGDGVIDAADDEFANLIVWQDANSDAVSQASELSSLTDLGIESIDLGFTAVDYEISGNAVLAESTYTMTGGVTRQVVDAWFTYDDVNSRYAEDYTLDIRTLFLPTARGYGDVTDLHIAMSLDETLLTKVQDIATADLATLFSPAFDLDTKLKDILYHWAGVDGVDPASRGAYIDGRDLAFLEAITAEPFEQRGNPDPLFEAAKTLENAFNDAYNTFLARVLVQSQGTASLFTQTAAYNPATDSFDGTFTLDLAAIDTTIGGLGLSGADLQDAWETMIRLIDHTIGLDNLSAADRSTLETMVTQSDPALTLTLQDVLDAIYEPVGLSLNGTNGDDTLIGGAGNDSLQGQGGDDTLYGREGNDEIYGHAGNDNLYGEEGNDRLFGNDGNDYLTGGLGDDTLQGGFDDDTYFYESGLDTVREQGGTDTIAFDTGITISNISISFSDTNKDDLNIYVDGALALRVEDHFIGNGNGRVETLSFSDSSTYDLGAVTAWQDGTIGDDTLTGADDAFFPHDLLSGLGGNDTLNGGLGNDILEGGSGDDTYLVTAGTDIIFDENGTDKIIFGTGLNSTDVSYDVDSKGNLHISFSGVLYATIENQFTGPSNKIETFEFDDGVSIQTADINFDIVGTSAADIIYGNQNFANTIYAGAGDDRVYGYDNDDTLYGESGFDNIYGGAGDDTIDGGADFDYLYGGEGNDTIIGGGASGDYLLGQGGNDTLHGGDGVISMFGGIGDDTYLFQPGIGTDYIIENVGAGTDTLVMGNGILPEDVRTTIDGNGNYILQIHGAGTLQITASLVNGVTDVSSRFERIMFDNGTIWDLTQSLPLNDTDSGNTILGTNDADIINGNGGDDTIYGNDGDDVINGGDGFDFLYGNDGNDVIDGGTGFDYVYGGEGNDTLRGDNQSGQAGNDTLHSGAGTISMYGGSGDDTYILEGGSGVDYIFEGAANGNDTLVIGNGILPEDVRSWVNSTGDFRIQTLGLGTVEIDASLVNGVTDVGTRFESVVFDDGTVWDLTQGLYLNDSDSSNTLYGTDFNDTINGKGGNDNIYGYGGNDILNGGTGFNYVYGGDGDDYITGNGDLRGENGNDTLYGGDGTQTLRGGADNDRLYGGRQTDYLYAGSGDDTLEGGQGTDHLYGQSGADTFLFTPDLGGVDRIYDFDTASGDVISLSSLLQGYDSTTSNINDFVQITDDGTDSYLSIDENGGGNSFIQIARIVGRTGLTDETALLTSGNLEINLAPVAVDDEFTTSQNTNVMGNVLVDNGDGADSDPNGTPLNVVAQTYETAQGGSVSILTNGDFTYMPPEEFTGIDSFTYIIDDGRGEQDTGTVTVTVSPDGPSITGTASNDSITGTNLSETINALGGHDTVMGLDGNDTLIGGAGNDTLYGDNDDDTFLVNGTGDGVDRIFGGAGTDTIQGGANDDNIQLSRLDVTDSIEVIDGGSGVNKLSGNGSNNVLNLSATTLVSIDHIDGLGGHDTITGSAGNDTIIGNTGNDTLRGEGGDDTFLINGTNDGVDRIFGGTGIDTIQGSAADDNIQLSRLDAADSIEVIDGGTGANILSGNGSNNVLDLSATTLVNIASINGGNGHDTITGSKGNDIIIGGTGNDTLRGEEGDDTFVISGVGDGVDRIFGGAGTDTIQGSDGDDNIQLNRLDAADSIEIIDGDTGTNILSGNGSNNVLDLSVTTLIDIDHIDGAAGHDTITGSAGNDTIIGGTGNDTLRGGAGDDVFLVNGTTDGIDRIFGNDGTDTILGNSGDDDIQLSRLDAADSIEIIDGSSGNNRITGNQSNNVLNFSATTLVAISSIQGLAGHDKITGSSGNDIIIGGTGNDTLYGEDGDDTFVINGTAEGVDRIFGGNGLDTIQGSDNDDDIQLSRLDAADSIEMIDGGLGNNTVSGNASNNVLDFSGTTLVNIDSINGGNGHDTITGSAGADTIIGGTGNDTLRGGNGDDILYSQDGLDTLFGDSGADTFVFESATAFNNIDIIQDFSALDGDAIDISELISGYDPLQDAITDFIEITSSGSDSILKVNANGGADNFVQVAILKGITGLEDEEALETNGNLIVA